MIRSICLYALCLFALTTAVRGEGWITYEAKDGPGRGKHIVLVAGDEEYRSEEGLPMLGKILSQRHGFTCTVLFPMDSDGTINPDRSHLPGAAQLDSADAIIIGLRFRHWPDDQMKHFVDAYQRGIPIVGLRTSTHAFQYRRDHETVYREYNRFGENVLGEEWISHWGPNHRGATRGVIEPSAKGDPLMRGVTDIFGDSGAYEAHPTPDSKILVRGQVLKGMKPTDPPADYRKKRRSDNQEQGINDPMMAVAWTRTHTNPAGKQSRVFCTTMGAATDLKSEGLRRLIVNAVYWGFGMEVPSNADVRYVDAYEPSDYSFKGYRRGIKPADHALGKTLPAGQPVTPRNK